MLLRSKVIGTLLGVFILYAIAAWLSLDFIYTSAFDRLEHKNASDQLRRVSTYIDAERTAADLFVIDWAQWDDTMEFVSGEYEDYYEDHLSESYINDLGMSFGAIIDTQGQLLWGEVYPDKDSTESLNQLFPNGIPKDSVLLHPVTPEELVSGLIKTAQGLAIISSGAILWNSGEGPIGGHFIAGKLLNGSRMDSISRQMLSPIDILSVESAHLPQLFHQALNELSSGKEQDMIVKQGDTIHALTLLRDIAHNPVGLLRVTIPAEISTLGASTLRTTITTLVMAALVLTLTLWIALKGILLIPIERLTAIIRGRETEHAVRSGQYLLSTVQHLADSRGLISKRNDEIGALISAFDDLSSSLHEASTTIWHAAHVDGLTDLANRSLFMEHLAQGIEVADTNNRKLTVMFIDLDDFKNVNDQYGHDVGDEVLSEVANRLRSVMGNNNECIDPNYNNTRNLVGRIGGDEFVVLIPSVEDSQRPEDIASEIVEAISSPILAGGHQCHIGACVGLASYPDDAVDLTGLLVNADTAMYEAKRAGKSCWREYKPGLKRFCEQKTA